MSLNTRPNHRTDPDGGRLLRCALLANAIFSFSTGFILLCFTTWFADLTAFARPIWLDVVGGSLLVFAGSLVWQATRPRLVAWMALTTSVADLVWVFGSLVLYLALPGLFNDAGWLVAAAIAVIVLIAGLLQLKGVRSLTIQRRNGSRASEVNPAAR